MWKHEDKHCSHTMCPFLYTMEGRQGKKNPLPSIYLVLSYCWMRNKKGVFNKQQRTWVSGLQMGFSHLHTWCAPYQEVQQLEKKKFGDSDGDSSTGMEKDMNICNVRGRFCQFNLKCKSALQIMKGLAKA